MNYNSVHDQFLDMTAVDTVINILKQQLINLHKRMQVVGRTPELMREFEFVHRQLAALQGE